MQASSPSHLPRRVNIVGVRISVTDYAEATRCVIDAAAAKRSLLLAASDVNLLMQARQDPAYAAVLGTFDIITPDGQPVRWGMHLTRQAQLADRVYGPTLMLHVCEAAAREGHAVFLYGSKQQTLDALSERLQQRYPELRIAGMRAGRFRPLTEAEQERDAHEINTSGAAIVFVGMGCPRQEWWLFHMRKRISKPMLAVGAAFDFHAGVVQQAPAWMQARGLEWAYRLSREPRRLWRRYVLTTPRYIPLIAAQAMGVTKFAESRDLAEAATRACPG